jgi:hypothetical protein
MERTQLQPVYQQLLHARRWRAARLPRDWYVWYAVMRVVWYNTSASCCELLLDVVHEHALRCCWVLQAAEGHLGGQLDEGALVAAQLYGARKTNKFTRKADLVG